MTLISSGAFFFLGKVEKVIILCTLFLSSSACTKLLKSKTNGVAGGGPLVMVWRTTTPNETITLPLRDGFNYNFTVNWGDSTPIGTVTVFDDIDRIHTYATAGDYTVTVTGLAEAWYFHNTGSVLNIIEVKNFGDLGWINLKEAFRGCSNLTRFAGGVTKDVIDMSDFFSNNTSLTSLNLSSFDTSKVVDMNRMFYNANSLTSLNVSNFNTSNVTSMNGMFSNLSSLTSLNISSFDTSKVTNMYTMFDGASSLTSLDLSNFDTSNVTNMGLMFQVTSSLTSLDLSNFDTSNVTNMGAMFYGASSLTSLDLSNFDTSNVTVMYSMFQATDGLTNLNLTSFDTSNVTSMRRMFFRASSLTSLDLSNFDTSNVSDMRNMFQETYSLTSLNVTNWDIVGADGTDIFTDANGGLDVICTPVSSAFFTKTCVAP